MILKDYLLTEVLKIRIKPETLQFPITGKCNSKCITCNIWKKKENNDVDVEKLKKILRDEYLSQIKYVGINGGEPFLHSNFIEVIKTITILPKLKIIYLISNGLNTEKILILLEEAYKLLKIKNIKLALTISLDGINDIYFNVRGIPNGDDKVLKTIKEIKSKRGIYCDYLSIGTTISNSNIYNIAEIKTISKLLNIPINYHLAIPDRRIYTNNDYSRYVVFSDERKRKITTEFFFGEFKYGKTFREKLLYFQNFYYLLKNGKERISTCNYKMKDLTLDENLNLYFCAKESKPLGKVNEKNIKDLLNSEIAKKENKRILENCNTCGHYILIPSIKGIKGFITELLKPGIWIIYQILCKIY